MILLIKKKFELHETFPLNVLLGLALDQLGQLALRHSQGQVQHHLFQGVYVDLLLKTLLDRLVETGEVDLVLQVLLEAEAEVDDLGEVEHVVGSEHRDNPREQPTEGSAILAALLSEKVLRPEDLLEPELLAHLVHRYPHLQPPLVHLPAAARHLQELAEVLLKQARQFVLLGLGEDRSRGQGRETEVVSECVSSVIFERLVENFNLSLEVKVFVDIFLLLCGCALDDTLDVLVRYPAQQLVAAPKLHSQLLLLLSQLLADGADLLVYQVGDQLLRLEVEEAPVEEKGNTQNHH